MIITGLVSPRLLLKRIILTFFSNKTMFGQRINTNAIYLIVNRGPTYRYNIVYTLTVRGTCVHTYSSRYLCTHLQFEVLVYTLTVRVTCVHTYSSRYLCTYLQFEVLVYILTVRGTCVLSPMSVSR